MLALVALQAGSLMHTTLRNPLQDLRWRRRPALVLAELQEKVGAAEAPVLADEFMGMVTLNDKPLYLQPFEATQLANAGLWDQQPLLDDIAAQDFAMILIHHYRGYPVYLERWTEEMLNAIRVHYAPTDWVGETLVYTPRDLESDPPVEFTACPGAPWRMPAAVDMGFWDNREELWLMDMGFEGVEPVYAVASGRLLREEDWESAVAIQHEDPLHPGRLVWTFYGDMAPGFAGGSFVAPDFPPGSDGVWVRKGQLLGYQGQRYMGGPTWAHVRFAVVPALADGSFPAPLVGLGTEADFRALPQEIREAGRLDPWPYLGIEPPAAQSPSWNAARCTAVEE